MPRDFCGSEVYFAVTRRIMRDPGYALNCPISSQMHLYTDEIRIPLKKCENFVEITLGISVLRIAPGRK